MPLCRSLIIYCVAALAALAAIGVIAPVDVFAQTATPPWQVLDDYCLGCHNLEDWAGKIAFDTADRTNLHTDAEIWEKAVRKLRSGMMPPAGEPRPERAVLDDLAQGLEHALDAAPTVNPGHKGLSRLNKNEYINAIADLLAFDMGKIAVALPADGGIEGFDNMAETLTMSPTLLEAYLGTAMEISRQAVGNKSIGATDIHYSRAGNDVQNEHIDGQPLGTRGGMMIEHHFPVDAEYVVRIVADIQQAGWVNDTHRMFWCGGPAVDVSFNNIRIAVEDYQSFRVRVPAGKQQINVALLDEKKCAGVGELYLGEALDSVGGAVQEIEIQGPFNVSGVHETPSRKAIFRCRPVAVTEENACAREILSYLATRAWRSLVQSDDPRLLPLLDQYTLGRTSAGGDFELGIQYALARLLVDPQFLYRFEHEPENIAPGAVYAVSPVELASRLSFFLWSSIPDETLLQLAFDGSLSEPKVLAEQVTRMLADPKSQALIDNFVGQWLKLRDLEDAAPQDAEFDEELRRGFRQETELLFTNLIRTNSSMVTLLDADYTYVNERLARHYGIEGVRGSYMRKVDLAADSPRRGLLGHGSILTATSIPNRTSPVVRGVWVVENILGAPVPDPPPGVETNLDAGKNAEGVVVADTLRARLEQHRADPVCASCHGIMDPIGLALENFDLTGRWRDQDNGTPIDSHSAMMDGTQLAGASDLRRALLSRSDAFINTLSGKLLSYALGRELEYFDGSAVRGIVSQAATSSYTFASLVQGIVTSIPFQQRLATGVQISNAAVQTAAAQP
ncbi:MAG: DUF1592 domain-containing protein [Pseudohongiellaceae bacterium]